MEIPELSLVPVIGNSRMPDVLSPEVCALLWKRERDGAWYWYDIRSDRDTALAQKEMQNLSCTGQKRNPLVPSFWRLKYGDDGINWTSFDDWDRQATPMHPAFVELEHIPALVSARQGGLTRIIILPYWGGLRAPDELQPFGHFRRNEEHP